jgi:protein-disulfide isomerase
MRSAIFACIVGISFSIYTLPARAQTAECDKLSGEQRKAAQEILASQHPYDCCDDTIAACLKQKPVCALAVRLANNICRRVAKKQPKQQIVRALSRRARTMLQSGSKAKIDLAGLPVAGDPQAPVTLVEYACARCPYCSKITPEIYDAVVSGRLKGKVKLYFKTFPIRSHEFSKETGLGFMAAVKLGRFWPFLLHSYKHFDNFCMLKQSDWAISAGMDKKAFEETVADPVTRELLVNSKKEGIVNKVDATPTFFINGKKYLAEINAEELIDVLEEEYERSNGR